MSHIIEEYSKCLGVRPGKFFINEHYFPIPYSKYITLDFDILSPADNYSYWINVVKLIRVFDPSIKIVDITEGRKHTADYADMCLMDTCSYRQISYIISNSSLHLCNNLYSSHIASSYNIPTVCIFGSLLPENNKPFFSSDIDCIQAETEYKPSYSTSDPLDLINKIKPEDIAKSVLDKINRSHDLEAYKTLKIGKYYNNKILEVIPDFTPDDDYEPERLINIRYDYIQNEESLEPWLQFKCNIMIETAIDINLIKKYRSNIAGMTVFCGDPSISIPYVNQLKALNINYNLICRNPKILPDIRLKFFDWNVEEYKSKFKKDLDFLEELCDTSFYDTNKKLLSKNKEYKSKAHWKHANSEPNHNKVIDCPEFWEEVEHMNIYNYDRKDNH